MVRLKILVSAYACSPYLGSEPGVGWNVVTQLSKYHDLTVFYGDLTNERKHKNDVEKWLDKNGRVKGLEFHYVKPTPLSQFWVWVHKFPGCKFFYYWGYNAWQKAAFAEAKELLKTQNFDGIHHLNITSFREPGYLYKLGIPFFWGPIAGASDEPWSYIKTFNLYTRVMCALRKIVNHFQKRFSYRSRIAARYATKIWASTPSDHHMVTNYWKSNATLLIETGSSPDPLRKPLHKKGNETLQLVWSGLHLPRKALPVALYALAKSGGGVKLTILGNGSETEQWKELAKKLCLENDLKWLGWLPKKDAIIEMSKAHAFIFTSVSEATSTVVLEALSLGLPVICHDACGMGIAVTSECGIKVPLQTPAKSVELFMNAIVKLRDEPGLVARLSENALKRALELTWDKKAVEMAQAYNEVISPQLQRMDN